MTPLTSAFLVVTHRCNLACRYCFVKQCDSDMSLQTAMKAVDFLYVNSKISGRIPDITFFGGEPLLRWDDLIVPTVCYIREELNIPCSLSITSNCTLLDREKAEFMKKHRVGLLFSIDGDKPTQDYNRPTHSGNGSFDLISDKIDLVREYFPTAPFRSTCIPATCSYTWDNIKFAIDRGFQTIYTVPNVFEEWPEDARRTMEECVRHYADYYIDCFRNGDRPAMFTSMKEVMQRIPLINHAAQCGQFRSHQTCTSKGKCGLASGHGCSISPQGDIYGCQEMTSNDGPDGIFWIGNLEGGVDLSRREALSKLWDNSTAKGPNCSTCKFNCACDGGCVANNYMITGDIHSNPEVYCWWKQVLLDEAIRIVQTLGGERNEFFRDYWRSINGR